MQTHKSVAAFLVENVVMPACLQIKTANNYRSDVKQVIMPDFSIQEGEEGLAYGLIDECGILIWIFGSGLSETVSSPGHVGGDGALHFGLELAFAGIVKTGRGLGIRSLELAEDHKRVMYRNPGLYQPGSTNKTGGINVQLTEDYRFTLGKPDEGIGAWSCRYQIDYEHPYPKG
jgi:hypothetical protein